MSSSFVRKSIWVCVAVAGLASSPVSRGDNITFFQFAGDPDFRSHYPEFSYDPIAGLDEAAGSTGNGRFISPGLIGIVTGGMQGIPYSPPGIGFGSYYNILSDLTLELDGFAPNGPAAIGASSTIQDLVVSPVDGTFTLKYTPKNFLGQVIGSDIILLTGKTNSAILVEQQSGGAAGVLSGTVTYTGGILYTGTLDIHGNTVGGFANAGFANHGAFSFSMTGISAPYTIDATTGRLGPFFADGAGTFDADAVPTPTALWGGLVVLGLVGTGRRLCRT